MGFLRSRRGASFVVLLLAVLFGLPSAPAGAASTYTQPVWFRWDTTVIDAIIVPPNHGQIYNDNGPLGGSEGGPGELTPTNSYLKAMEASALEFKDAVAKFGSKELKKKFKLNIYVLGRDTIPSAAMNDPEIVVVTDESKAMILGISFSSDPCISNSSKFFLSSFTYADMYSVSGHEFGHCLGLDHVSGGEPKDKVFEHDLMHDIYMDEPGSAGTHRHCVSNLNVKGLEGSILGRTATPSVSSTKYATTSC